jgi:hypothetical protein
MHPDWPPGHRPGFHIPGTLVPIGAVVQQQAEMERQRAAAEAEVRRRARNLLLLLLN